MAANTQSISLLEQEARALRARIVDLGDDDFPEGIATSDGDEPESRRQLREAQRKLAEVEAELRGLQGTGGR